MIMFPYFIMTKIMGLDVSSISTGYCIFNKGKLIKSSCGIIKTNPRKSYGNRLQSFEIDVKELIQKHKPDIIIVEDIYKGRNIKTFKSLAMFRGVVIKAIYDEINKDPISLSASVVRSFLKIKNKKEIAFDFIVSKYKLDYNFKDHNDIVDSIVLGLAVHEMMKQGLDEKSIQDLGRRKKSRRKRNKKSL